MKFIAIALLLLTSCHTQSVHSFRNLFDADLISHFPQDDKAHRVSASCFFPEQESFYNLGVYLRETYELPKSTIDTLINSLEESNYLKVKHNDSCGLYIELYFNHDLNKNSHCNDQVPLPNFWEEILALDFKERKYLPDDFDLFIIECDSGKYISEDFLFDKTEIFGNKEWKNGISKGIAVSSERKMCIYWLEIW